MSSRPNPTPPEAGANSIDSSAGVTRRSILDIARKWALADMSLQVFDHSPDTHMYAAPPL